MVTSVALCRFTYPKFRNLPLVAEGAHGREELARSVFLLYVQGSLYHPKPGGRVLNRDF